MDGLTLAITTQRSASYPNINKFLFRSLPHRVKSRTIGKSRELWCPRNTKFKVLAAKEDEPNLNQWDQMELKFGRVLGEDPKLTLAKILARKANPDVSFVDVEKSFYKNKGKLVETKELPFDVPDGKKKSSSNSLDGLNLVRPVPKGGFDYQDDNKPAAMPEVKKPKLPVQRAAGNDIKRSVPNVILRKKPAMFVEDDAEDKQERSRLRIKPNLTLRMGNGERKEKFSDMTLLRKPEPVTVNRKQDDSRNVEVKKGDDGIGIITGGKQGQDGFSGFTLLKKPETVKSGIKESLEIGNGSNQKEQLPGGDASAGMQPLEKTNTGLAVEETTINGKSDRNDVDSTVKHSVEAPLQVKPTRLDRSMQEASTSIKQENVLARPGSFADSDELDNLPAISPLEDADWTKAENLFKTGERMEVELISFSTGGFAVSFGSLVGFLPYRNLAAKWKFLAFESWLRQKGLDPSVYKKDLGLIGNYDVREKNSSFNSSGDSKLEQTFSGDIMPDKKLEDLLRIYDQEKLKFLSSFVGQKIKVNVVMADRNLRKLIVSVRPKEKEESVERKRTVMAKLQIGDIVKCCIKKITYFGIFVEVEGVPALIHQTEVSWDATLDPTSYFKVGQIVEAKVHQLDFALDRIFLSLKEITPDPLMEALETVIGDRDPLDGRLQSAEADTEWPDVKSLIKELQQIEGIQSVSKGRFFFSPGLAPTFQVYMASMFENQYKLLARSGNKVQEVIVEASLDKEEMKSAILSCANRVE